MTHAVVIEKTVVWPRHEVPDPITDAELEAYAERVERSVRHRYRTNAWGAVIEVVVDDSWLFHRLTERLADVTDNGRVTIRRAREAAIPSRA